MSLPRRIFHDWGGVERRGRVPLDGNSERKTLPAPNFTANDIYWQSRLTWQI
ncbi:Hypothetical protein FKW44_001105 [Caligus rogercresseyi]|uniref:Uncharacterized protein n=1 Tax=Caligus rogercresseyi TaxID=217165 RepID=A0A7T8QVB2_CALRO|nr:Hypothetical protein FKW44_001105 [Caligus rogercresseyi]